MPLKYNMNRRVSDDDDGDGNAIASGQQRFMRLVDIPNPIAKPGNANSKLLADTICSIRRYTGNLTLGLEESAFSEAVHYIDVSVPGLFGNFKLFQQDLFTHLVNGLDIIEYLMRHCVCASDRHSFMVADFEGDEETWLLALQQRWKGVTTQRAWTRKPLNFVISPEDRCLIGMNALAPNSGICKCTECDALYNHVALSTWLKTKNNCPHCRALWLDRVYYTTDRCVKI